MPAAGVTAAGVQQQEPQQQESQQQQSRVWPAPPSSPDKQLLRDTGPGLEQTAAGSALTDSNTPLQGLYCTGGGGGAESLTLAMRE